MVEGLGMGTSRPRVSSCPKACLTTRVRGWDCACRRGFRRSFWSRSRGWKLGDEKDLGIWEREGEVTMAWGGVRKGWEVSSRYAALD